MNRVIPIQSEMRMAYTDSEIDMQLKRNRKYIRLMNHFSSLDGRFPTIHDKHDIRLRTYLSLLRFGILFAIGFKLTIISILNGAYPRFRALLMDWTIINPPISSVHMIRFMATLNFLGLCIKRGLFSKETLYPGVQEFMVQDPRHLGSLNPIEFDNKNNSSIETQSNHEMTTTVDKPSLDAHSRTILLAGISEKIKGVYDRHEILRQFEAFLERWFDSSTLKTFVGLLMGTPSQAVPKGLDGYKFTRKDFHTIQNWFLVSQTFERSFIRTCKFLTITNGATLLIGCSRIILFSRRPPECQECTQALMWFALCETFIVCFDGFFCIVGLLAHVNSVVIYLRIQATWTEQFIRNYIRQLDTHAMMLQRDQDLTMRSQAHNDGDPDYGDHDSEVSSLMSTIRKDHTTTSTCTMKSRDRLIVNERPFHRNTSSDFLRRSNNSIPKSYVDGTDIHRMLDVCKKRVLDLLYSFDEQKPLLSFLTTIEYLWLISTTTALPLLLIISRVGLTVARPLVGYLFAAFLTPIICIKIAIDCANVNYATLQVGRLMFSVCARFPAEPIQMHWSRIYYNWYFPVRCVFKVADVFELTYLNIVKTFSYAISITTLYLNFNNRF